MIGREENVSPLELIRWAREQARRTHTLETRSEVGALLETRAYRLSNLEGHVLLLLATYANRECKCWPSLRLLAECCGLKVAKDGRNSSVSSALARLEHVGLIWTKPAGRGKSSVRELLIPPGRQAGNERRQHPVLHGAAKGNDGDQGPRVDGLPHDVQDASLTAARTRSTRRSGQLPERPKKGTDQRGSLTTSREAARPPRREGELQRLDPLVALDVKVAV